MYPNLKEALARKDISQREIAAHLDIHENSIRNKISGSSSFSIEEAFKVKDRFFPDYDLKYLFRKIDENQINKSA